MSTEMTTYGDVQFALKQANLKIESLQQQNDAMRKVLEKFVAKVESGQARSVETYAEAKAALALGTQPPQPATVGGNGDGV